MGSLSLMGLRREVEAEADRKTPKYFERVNEWVTLFVFEYIVALLLAYVGNQPSSFQSYIREQRYVQPTVELPYYGCYLLLTLKIGRKILEFWPPRLSTLFHKFLIIINQKYQKENDQHKFLRINKHMHDKSIAM